MENASSEVKHHGIGEETFKVMCDDDKAADKVDQPLDDAILKSQDITSRKLENAVSDVKHEGGETSKVMCDDDKVAGKVDQSLDDALKSQETDIKTSEVSALNITESKGDTQLKVPMKKRNTKRIARQYNTSESKSNVTCIQPMENLISIDDAIKHNNPLWFAICLAKDKNGNSLPKLDKVNYIRIKNLSFTVAGIQKYVKVKLNLEDESEVEIWCRGTKLDPTMNLHGIEKHWLECLFPSGFMPKTKIWAYDEAIIALEYSRCISTDAPNEA